MRYKIILNSHYFIATAGGTDLFIKFLNSFLINKNQQYFVLLSKNNLISILRKILFPIKNFLIQIILKKNKEFKLWPMQKGSNEIFNFIKNKKNFRIIDGDHINFKQITHKINPDIIFPCLNPLPEFKNKNIGYIFDLQHEYLPQLFNILEIKKRRENILNVLNYSRIVIVNSIHTKNTLLEKYKKKIISKNIFSIPFCPTIPNIYFDWNLNLKNKYKITNEYFMVCNQFWKHKNHKFAINSFLKYCSFGGTHDLIMTGELSDRRFPTYYHEIKSIIDSSNFAHRIKILGSIEKKKQISLLRNAKALIQPTLFEGGPGGGSANEAIALDVAVLASNIPVNLELNKKNVSFFNPHNTKELIQLLFSAEKKMKNKTPAKILKSLSNRQNEKLSVFYEKVFRIML